MTVERTVRLLLKVLQFLVSLFVVYCLFRTGPQWMLTLACLVVPPFCAYLMLKSPDQQRQRTPEGRYWANAKGKSWLRVDITICFTMAVVFLGFAIILFYGFFQLLSTNVHLLFAGIGSLIAAMLYLFNAIIGMSRLRSGSVGFTYPDSQQRQIETSDKAFTRVLPPTALSNVRPGSASLTATPARGLRYGESLGSVGYIPEAGSRNYVDVYSVDDYASTPIHGIPDHNAVIVEQTGSSGTSSNATSSGDMFEISDRLVPSQSKKPKKIIRYRCIPPKPTYIARPKLIVHPPEDVSSETIDRDGYNREIREQPPPLPQRPPPPIDDERLNRIARFNERFVAAKFPPPSQASRALNEAERYESYPSSSGFRPTPDISNQMGDMQRIKPPEQETRSKNFVSKGTGTDDLRNRKPLFEDNFTQEDSSSVTGSVESVTMHEYESATTLDGGNHLVRPLEIGAAEDDNDIDEPGYTSVRARIAVLDSNASTSQQFGEAIRSEFLKGEGPVHYKRRTYRQEAVDGEVRSRVEEKVEIQKNAGLEEQPPPGTDPSFIVPIVTAIDSSRESEIIRHSSFRRKRSRTEKMTNIRKGFDVLVRTQSDGELSSSRPSSTSPSRKHSHDEIFVTEF